ncbi:Phomenoic acid biosynthesis cluster MFS-type transporter [Pseudocercospora fuligena]|uniref:Phomenoic acid biosynthesis cluster MFS-type transporter n=1 Tax=Pseudocercospora fuligena TaxID=685502 RepID=A0A8H6VKW1_9PEZI|nr:Phomenoic acid biosynthesis cluster MFS-type transporter [Pseudocercospora fuligena]
MQTRIERLYAITWLLLFNRTLRLVRSCGLAELSTHPEPKGLQCVQASILPCNFHHAALVLQHSLSQIVEAPTMAPAEKPSLSDAQPTHLIAHDVESLASIASEPPSELPEIRKLRGLKWFLVVLSILSSVLLYALDNTITADVIPVIVRDMGGIDKLPWLSVSFMIGGVCFVLPFGSMYALFDAKKLYITCILLFLIGSAVCGAAPNIDAFIVGRVIAGIGGIGIYLGVMTLLSCNTTGKEKPMYLGLVGLIFGIGNVIGPLIGGAFADSSATWRWGFYINLCLIGLLSPVYLFLIPSYRPQPGRTILTRFAQIDAPGTVLSIGCLVCLVMGVNFGGTLYAWKSAATIVPFVLAVVLLAAFVFQQRATFLTTKASRLFPATLLRDREAILLFVLTATFNSAGFIPIYYIPTYFQFTRGDSPLQSGVRLLPLIITITFMIMVNGSYLSKGGYYMPWFLAGSLLVLVAGVLFSLIDVNTSMAHIYGYSVLLGIGSGCGMQSGFSVIQAITKPELMSSGIAFIMIGISFQIMLSTESMHQVADISLAQLLSVSLALSICGTIFVNTALESLQSLLVDYSRTELQAALLGLSGEFLASLDSTQRAQTLSIIVESMAKVFIPVYVAAAVGIGASLGLRMVKMAPAVAM